MEKRKLADLPEPDATVAAQYLSAKKLGTWILMGTGSRDQGRLQKLVDYTLPEKGHVHIKGSVDGWREVHRFYVLPLWTNKPTK